MLKLQKREEEEDRGRASGTRDFMGIESSQNGSPVTRNASMLDGKSTRLDGMISGLFLPLRDGTLGAPMIVPAHRWQAASRVARILLRTSDGRGSTDSTDNGREDGRSSRPKECSETETMIRQMKEKWCEISTRRRHEKSCLSSKGKSSETQMRV